MKCSSESSRRRPRMNRWSHMLTYDTLSSIAAMAACGRFALSTSRVQSLMGRACQNRAQAADDGRAFCAVQSRLELPESLPPSPWGCDMHGINSPQQQACTFRNRRRAWVGVAIRFRRYWLKRTAMLKRGRSSNMLQEAKSATFSWKLT